MIPRYCGITYDPTTNKFEVDISTREFTTKRSAMRFVKRWRDKLDGVKPKPKHMSFKTRKAEILKREMVEYEEYLERLGV